MTLRTAFGTAAAAIRRILSLLQVMSSQVLSACTERTDEAGEKAAEHCRTAESPTTPIARRVRSIVPGCRPVLALPCIDLSAMLVAANAYNAGLLFAPFPSFPAFLFSGDITSFSGKG
jgi:hypothetical protein